MSATIALLIIAGCWLALGLASAVVLGRRGHDPFTWLAVGAVLGPLSIPLAAVGLRQADGRRQLAPGLAGAGPVDVLVGIDGSPTAGAALGAVLELVGPRIGRLTLAAVAELDDTAAVHDHERALCAELERQAAIVRARRRPVPGGDPVAGQPELILLTGEPAAALERLACADGYDLLAVGGRGAGLSTALLGSVATRLAAGAKVPVLIGPPVPAVRAGTGVTSAAAGSS